MLYNILNIQECSFYRIISVFQFVLGKLTLPRLQGISLEFVKYFLGDSIFFFSTALPPSSAQRFLLPPKKGCLYAWKYRIQDLLGRGLALKYTFFIDLIYYPQSFKRKEHLSRHAVTTHGVAQKIECACLAITRIQREFMSQAFRKHKELEILIE